VVKRNCPKIYIPNPGHDPEMDGHTLSSCVQQILGLVRKDAQAQATGADAEPVAAAHILQYVLLDQQGTHAAEPACFVPRRQRGSTPTASARRDAPARRDASARRDAPARLRVRKKMGSEPPEPPEPRPVPPAGLATARGRSGWALLVPSRARSAFLAARFPFRNSREDPTRLGPPATARVGRDGQPDLP